jgi:glycerol kinase
MLNTGSEIVPSRHGLLTTVGWQIGDQVTYCLEGSAFMAGAVVQWLRDGLGLITSSAEVEALARAVPDAGGVVLVPAHAGLGAPHWRPDARGLLCGLTRGTTRAHVARAAREGIAHEVTDLIEAMNADVTARGGQALARLRVDGGAAANDLLMQTQADLLRVELDRPAMLETTALGAVFLAGLGAGLWRDTDALRSAWRLDRSFAPGAEPAITAAARRAWASAVARA